MKITVESKDERLPKPQSYKKIVFGDEHDMITADDWTFIFEELKIRLTNLKNENTSNVGAEIVKTRKIEHLEMLLDKYKSFIDMTNDISLDYL